MGEPFRVGWFGGAAERRVRRERSLDVDFASLDPSAYPEPFVTAARAAWTYGAYQEYCSAAAFATLQTSLLEAGAPIDLVACAGSFVADEMFHVELNTRIALALGGGISPPVDLKVTPKMPGSALEQALAIAVRTCCVGEAFSLPVLAGTRACSTHPVIRAVLDRIVRDEAPHSQLGWWILEWAQPDETMRARLGEVAQQALDQQLQQLQNLPPDPVDPSLVHALGWMTASEWAESARRAVQRSVVEPLQRMGIEVSAGVSCAHVARAALPVSRVCGSGGDLGSHGADGGAQPGA